MRRRIVFAVFLAVIVVLAAVVVRLIFVALDFDTVITTASFDTARDDHTVLRAFLHRMPKGGDLHTHLSGAVYAERFIAWAAQKSGLR
jgi:adenosine deaminase